MKCMKCGFDWQTYGEDLSCPSCGSSVALSTSEKQSLWEQIQASERIKDRAARASCLLTLAEQGDAKAAYAYAECLSEGDGVEKDREEALLWYKAAAAKKHPAAAYRLAESLRDKRFGNNAGQVFFWTRVAAEFGDMDAAFKLYSMYEEGEGTEPSHRHALYYLLKSARAEHVDAISLLAKMYATGDGLEKDLGAARFLLEHLPHPGFSQKMLLRKLAKVEAHEPDEIELPSEREECLMLGKRAAASAEHAVAAHLYFTAAYNGEIKADYALGLCFERGEGVPKNPTEAHRRFTIAAEGGLAEAYIKLGDYAKNGTIAPADPESALRFYEKASELGLAEGAFLVAEAYRFGTLAKIDLKKALAFYNRANAMGHKEAKEREHEIREAVSTLYDRALDHYRKADYAAAFTDFSRSANMGHAAACFCLGVMYAEGVGCKKNAHSAVYYYRLAAEQGNIDAIYRLGAAYADGFGVRRDFKAAESFFGIAAKQSYKDAAARVETIKRIRHKKKAQKVYSISSVLYRKGDVAEAIHFRSVAAKLGNARAMYALGCHYEFGDGVPMDRERAAGWFTYAKNAGFRVTARSDYKGGFLRERKLLLLRKRSN